MPAPACPSPSRHHSHLHHSSSSSSSSRRHDNHQPYTGDNPMRDSRFFRTPPPTLLMDQMQISQPQPYSQSPTSYLIPHELQQQHLPQRTRPRRQSLVANDSQLGGPLPLNSSMPNGNATADPHRYSQLHPGQRQYRSSGSTYAPSTDSPYSTSNTYQVPHAPHPQLPSQLRNIAPRPGPLRSQQQQQQQQYLRQFQQQRQNQQRPQAQGQGQGQAQPFPNNISPSLHPQFRAKAVCRLTCRSCLSDVCMRGMKAILLADSRIELYSTDRPPAGVQLVYDDYRTRNCKCRIRDVACLGCGNTLGYHVTQPCESCLEACNNGHFWMFHSDGVSCTERFLPRTASAARAARAARAALSFSASSGSSEGAGEGQGVGRRNSTRRGGVTAVVDQEAQDLSWRRRTSIHDIEYNNAVGNNPVVVGRHRSSAGHGGDDCGIEEEEEGEIEEDEGEDVEEEPVVMLWAALHAQEERYLQQIQHQQLQIQQQQRMQQERRQQQDEEDYRRVSPVVTVAAANSASSASSPNVGSPHRSLISTAISNASMMLWDEGRTLNQYEQLCR
ncbi:Protein fam72a [Podila minutissima]|uniref:Protein fam72a n=1 Tax=Podila minutissima TaxID=64525 RepID=A0A9P5SNZ5_9FUNG|nr:Protein fam72a [Podila minutissima]